MLPIAVLVAAGLGLLSPPLCTAVWYLLVAASKDETSRHCAIPLPPPSHQHSTAGTVASRMHSTALRTNTTISNQTRRSPHTHRA